MKLSNLFKQELPIVNKRKRNLIIPAIVVVIALIAGVIWGLVTGSAVNLGMDFTGGYTFNVKLSTRLTDENYPDYVKRIESIFTDLTDDAGNNYGLKTPVMQMQGSSETASIYIKYLAVEAKDGVDVQSFMENEVNVRLEEELGKLFNITPISHSYDGSVLTMKYSESISEPILTSIRTSVLSEASNNGINLTAENIVTETNNIKVVKISVAGINDEKVGILVEAATIPDQYAGQAVKGDIVSATVSNELWVSAILAVALALVLMLVYIIFRFEISMGLIVILGLLHDVIFMFATVVIFHIEINSTFIAALITIIGYSINNSIILFDRVRENRQLAKNKGLTSAELANKSVNETLTRTLNTTITTLLTIGCVALIGVESIRIFAIPVIMGLIGGVYSTVFILPTLWAMWKERLDKRYNKLATEKK